MANNHLRIWGCRTRRVTSNFVAVQQTLSKVLWCRLIAQDLMYASRAYDCCLWCHSKGSDESGQGSQLLSFGPGASTESAFLQAMNRKPSTKPFTMFPPSAAAHFPMLAVNLSLRSPGCSLSQSRQRFSLARNKKAFCTGPRVAQRGQGLHCPAVQLRSVSSV